MRLRYRRRRLRHRHGHIQHLAKNIGKQRVARCPALAVTLGQTDQLQPSHRIVQAGKARRGGQQEANSRLKLVFVHVILDLTQQRVAVLADLTLHVRYLLGANGLAAPGVLDEQPTDPLGEVRVAVHPLVDHLTNRESMICASGEQPIGNQPNRLIPCQILKVGRLADIMQRRCLGHHQVVQLNPAAEDNLELSQGRDIEPILEQRPQRGAKRRTGRRGQCAQFVKQQHQPSDLTALEHLGKKRGQIGGIHNLRGRYAHR